MPKPLIIANWKCNPDALGRAIALAKKIEEHIRGSRVEVVIAPPFAFLSDVRKNLRKVKLGAQDASWIETGPYTGEVSPHQLKHLGVAYAILGHSERRSLFGETDEMVNKKIRAVLEKGIGAVLCVGERERNGDIASTIGGQMKKGLAGVKKSDLKNLVIAYEPLWAISTNPNAEADTPDNAFRVSLYIKKILAALFDRAAGDRVRIIYGGSVRAANVRGFLSEGKMQGALVGGASLDPKEFGKIITEASRAR